MKRLLTLVGAIATLAAGVTAAVALGAGSDSPDTSTGTIAAATAGATITTAPDTATGTTATTTAPDTLTGATTATTAADPATGTTATTTAPDTATGTTATVASGATAKPASSKVWVCHHTGSWKHPYHLIYISAHALPAHMNHGGVTPGPDNSCPTTQPAGGRTHNKNEQTNKAKMKQHNPGKDDDKTDTNDD